MNRELHIVCLDVPWPADYGGAIDMMNRLTSIRQAGIGIHLHYFSYNERGIPRELAPLCKTVHVYDRVKKAGSLSGKLPYIVASRINEELITNLQADDHPVLLEGLHCTGILPRLDLDKRKLVVRMHNEESVYYRELARAESSWMKKFFFRRESRLIKRYMETLPGSCTYACLSEDDRKAFVQIYQLPRVFLLPIFPSWQSVNGEEGMGNLCLYHGNLSVPENEKAAIWLLTKVFTKTRMPFVIAGKKPSRRLRKLSHLCQHTCLVADPSEKEMNDLVRKAHIHVLPCFARESTGIRLKLLHALFEGRHCLVNEPMVRGTGLDGACHIATNAESFASVITQLYHQPFSVDEINLRRQMMGDVYDNEKNTRLLIQYLW